MPGTGAGRAWAFFSYQSRNALDAKTAYWFPRRSLDVLIPSNANLTSHILVCGFGHKGNQVLTLNVQKQSVSLLLLDGLAGLTSVESKLTKSQLRVRDEAIHKARKFMANAAAAGGAPARSYSFQNRDVVRRKGNERVDIVVNCGFAFVP
jgi:voltage-gated potassium channel Kch